MENKPYKLITDQKIKILHTGMFSQYFFPGLQMSQHNYKTRKRKQQKLKTIIDKINS